MRKDIPQDQAIVEILVDDKWIKARFIEADSSGDYCAGTFNWWGNYFSIEGPDYRTVPDNVCSGDVLPAWRPIGLPR